MIPQYVKLVFLPHISTIIFPFDIPSPIYNLVGCFNFETTIQSPYWFVSTWIASFPWLLDFVLGFLGALLLGMFRSQTWFPMLYTVELSCTTTVSSFALVCSNIFQYILSQTSLVLHPPSSYPLSSEYPPPSLELVIYFHCNTLALTMEIVSIIVLFIITCDTTKYGTQGRTAK